MSYLLTTTVRYLLKVEDIHEVFLGMYLKQLLPQNPRSESNPWKSDVSNQVPQPQPAPAVNYPEDLEIEVKASEDEDSKESEIEGSASNSDTSDK